MQTRFRLNDSQIDFDIRHLVVAGWTGRDQAAVQHHIDELKTLGVAPPSRTPLFYRVGADRLTQTDRIQVVGPATSGEVEAVLIAGPDSHFVTLGSDHTDREAEAFSVALSKQLCAKPVAADVWLYDDVAPHWDKLVLRSWAWIEGARQPYQQGTLAEMLPAADLIAGYGALVPGSAMFCGTLPAIGGVRPASRFEMELEDPVLGRTLTHSYDIDPLPVVS